MDALGRFMNRYRSTARPTFVEVDASPVLASEKRRYDLINASLLVSNEQRPFFAQPDLERQTAELRALVGEQHEIRRLIGARLKLFGSFHNAQSAEFALRSLRRRRRPDDRR
jgi:hypothetical protein